MMKTYIYPQNLRAQATLWLWSLKDLAVAGAAALLSVLAAAQIKTVVPLALSAAYAFLTIRFDDRTVLDFLRQAARFFITSQQYFEWRQGR